MADVVIVRECRHGQVRVLYGDIIRVEGDVMVIPANSRLAGREGLDEKMQQAAGTGLREHCAGIAKERRKRDVLLSSPFPFPALGTAIFFLRRNELGYPVPSRVLARHNGCSGWRTNRLGIKLGESNPLPG